MGEIERAANVLGIQSATLVRNAAVAAARRIIEAAGVAHAEAATLSVESGDTAAPPPPNAPDSIGL